MEYKKLEYAGARAGIARFDIGRSEAHVVVRTTLSGAPFSEQLKSVQHAIGQLSVELSRDMQPVFKRYYLSDAANQSEMLPRDEECAVSIIQQQPLDGTKVAVLMFWQADADFRNMGNGIWENFRGQIWFGDNGRVVNADSQTMTVGYLELLERELATRKASLAQNCVRTWFFVRDVDVNYAGVVKGRNEVFDRCGLTSETHFIASTGIEGRAADKETTVAFNAYAETRLVDG